MPVSKLKNLILLILLLCNLALLCLLVPRKLEQRQEAQNLRVSLSALCEKQNVLLDPDIIPQTIALYSLELAEHTLAELDALQAIAGEDITYNDGKIEIPGAPQTSHWENGAIRLKLTEKKPVSNLRNAAKKELDAMAFQYAKAPQPERRSPGTYDLWAEQTVLGVPVFSRGLTLTYVNSCLAEVSGDFFAGTLTKIDSHACMPASDAVVSFLSARVDLGWVGSSITAMEQGYLPTSSSGAARLIPVWKLSTDTGSFYINGISGDVFSVADSSI